MKYSVLFAWLLLTSVSALAEENAEMEQVHRNQMQIVLHNAITISSKKQAAETADLTLDVRRHEDGWQGWATSHAVPLFAHPVHLDNTFHGTVTILPHPGRPIVLGGALNIQIAPEAQTFTATFATPEAAALPALARAWRCADVAELQNLVTATLSVAKTGSVHIGPRTQMGSLQARAGRPRLLMDVDDLQTLRAHAKTDQGQGMVSVLRHKLAMDRDGYAYRPPGAPTDMNGQWAAGYGAAVALGDEAKSTASRAIEGLMPALFAPPGDGRGWAIAWRIAGTAQAYDLLAEYWDPQTRYLVAAYLERAARLIATGDARMPGDYGEEFMFAFDRNHEGEWFSAWDLADTRHVAFVAAGLQAALALYGEPLPQSPSLDAAIIALPSLAQQQAHFGETLNPFSDDRMLPEWLVCGPFLATDKGLDNPGSIQPVAGDVIDNDGIQLHWRHFYAAQRAPAHIDHGEEHLEWHLYPRTHGARLNYTSKYGGYEPAAAVIKRAEDQLPRKRWYLATLLRIERETLAQARWDAGAISQGTRAWINGQAVADGARVRLSPGLHRIILEIRPLGGYVNMAPRLRLLTAGAAAAKGINSDDTARAQPDIEYYVHALIARLRAWQRSAVDHEGAGVWYQHELVIPALHAARRAGIDLVTGTAYERLATIAAQQGFHQAGNLQRGLAQALPFLPPKEARRARHQLLTRSGWVHMPDQVLMPLLHAIGDQQQESASALHTNIFHKRSGIVTWSDPQAAAPSMLVDAGLGLQRFRGLSGSVAVIGKQAWIPRPHRDDRRADPIRTLIHIPGTDFSAEPRVNWQDPIWFMDRTGKRASGRALHHQRWVGGFYPTGGGAVMAIADRITGHDEQTVQWRLHLPMNGFREELPKGLSVLWGDHTITWQPTNRDTRKPINKWLQVQFASDAPLTLRKVAHGKNGQLVFIAQLRSPAAAEQEGQPDELSIAEEPSLQRETAVMDEGKKPVQHPPMHILALIRVLDQQPDQPRRQQQGGGLSISTESGSARFDGQQLVFTE